MSKEEIHAAATEDLPDSIAIPKTWPALIVWAIGKWGVGVVGFALVIPVYQDLKSSNERFAKLSEANVAAIQQLANQITRIQDSVGRMEARVNP